MFFFTFSTSRSKLKIKNDNIILMEDYRVFVNLSLNYIKGEVFLHTFMSLCLASLLIKIFLSNKFASFSFFKFYVKGRLSNCAAVL